MRFFGNKAGAFGAFEAQGVIDWLGPVLLTVVIANGAELVGVLTVSANWRAALAGAAVIVGRGVYQWLRDNSKDRT